MASSEIPAALQRVSAPCTAGRAPAPPRSHPAGAMRCAWTRAGPHPACAHGELQALGWVHRRAWDCMLHACKQIGAHVKGTCRSSLCLFNFFGGVGMQVPSLGPCHRTRVAPRPPAHLCQHRRAAQALARTRPGKSALRQPCAYSGARRGPAAARAAPCQRPAPVHHGRIACAYGCGGCGGCQRGAFGGPGPRLADGDAGAPRPHRVRQLARAEAAGRPERPAAQAREARAQLERQQRAARAQAVPRQHQPPALHPGRAASAPAAGPTPRLCPISASRQPCVRPRPSADGAAG